MKTDKKHNISEDHPLLVSVYGKSEIVKSEQAYEEYQQKKKKHEEKYGKTDWRIIKQAQAVLGTQYGDSNKKNRLFFDGEQYMVGPNFKISIVT